MSEQDETVYEWKLRSIERNAPIAWGQETNEEDARNAGRESLRNRLRNGSVGVYEVEERRIYLAVSAVFRRANGCDIFEDPEEPRRVWEQVVREYEDLIQLSGKFFRRTDRDSDEWVAVGPQTKDALLTGGRVWLWIMRKHKTLKGLATGPSDTCLSDLASLARQRYCYPVEQKLPCSLSEHTTGDPVTGTMGDVRGKLLRLVLLGDDDDG